MPDHRLILAEHLAFPAPEAPEADPWHEHEGPAKVEPRLARRLAPDLLLPDEEPAAVRDRARQLISSLKPWDSFELWLTGRVALQEIRLARCRAQELLERDRLARRAVLCWDEDRRAAVASLGAKLGRRPDEVAPALGRSRHGCEWLLARWDALAATLDEAGTWDEDHRRRALDLLAIPRAERSGRTPLDPPAGVDAEDHLREVTAAERGRLRALKASALDELDARDREAAALGVAPDDRELARLRRAERSHERSLQLYLARFKQTRSGAYLSAEAERGPLRRPESTDLEPSPATPIPSHTHPGQFVRGVPLAACPPVSGLASTGGQAASGTQVTPIRADFHREPHQIPAEVSEPAAGGPLPAAPSLPAASPPTAAEEAPPPRRPRAARPPMPPGPIEAPGEPAAGNTRRRDPRRPDAPRAAPPGPNPPDNRPSRRAIAAAARRA